MRSLESDIYSKMRDFLISGNCPKKNRAPYKSGENVFVYMLERERERELEK